MGDGMSEILFEIRDGLARVTFNRPQARNALTFAMYEGLAAACGAVNADETVRAMIVTGAGDRAFAAGTDIGQFRDLTTPEDALAYEARIDRVLSALEACRVPTLAAIAGACTGGGAAIAGACDLRIASRDARIGFPIARTLGNCLSLASLARLTRLVGPMRVKEMIYTARLLTAEEAAAAGFVTEVAADAPALQARTEELAALIAGHAPLTLRATKEGLRRMAAGAGPEEGADLVVGCYMSEDFREGMSAFLEKRPPRWRGR